MLNGDRTRNVVTLAPKAGGSVTLFADGSSDPDGNPLTYRWWVYAEPGLYRNVVTPRDDRTARATVPVPDAAGKSIHVILELKDNGSPALTSYRRTVLNVQSEVGVKPE